VGISDATPALSLGPASSGTNCVVRAMAQIVRQDHTAVHARQETILISQPIGNAPSPVMT